MSKKTSGKNRNFVFEERFRLGDADDAMRFTDELIELNRVYARYVVTVGSRFIVLHVHCRTDHSRSYRLCKKLLYDEI